MLLRLSDEVFATAGGLQTIGPAEIEELKRAAALTPRRRSRVCLHPGPDAPVHEMVIVHHRETYVRPHRHPQKAESLLVLEGRATAVVFDEHGAIARRIVLQPPGWADAFLYRIAPLTWHGLVIDSEWLVFIEIAAGPFGPTSNDYATFAPDGTQPETAAAYIDALRERLRS